MKKLRLTVAALLLTVAGATASAYTPATFWIGFTTSDCSGQGYSVYVYSTLEWLWNNNQIRSWREYSDGVMHGCQNAKLPYKTENTQ
jgi:hypothetical protein